VKLHAVLTAAALGLAAPIIAGIALPAHADGDAPQIVFRNGHFEPARLSVAAGRSLTLKVSNAGPSAIEFESFELNRERVVQPGQTITVYLPSLSPGSYKFFDDFDHKADEVTLVAR
jgi:hypothetical protein